jgi:hypothetical protein
MVGRGLAGSLDLERVSAIRWERPDQPAIDIVKTGGGWTWGGIPASRRAVDDALASLRASWHRRAPARQAGTVHATIRVTAGATTRSLGIGEPLAGGDQVWLVDDDHALLVDAWVARALDLAPLDLRIRHPFADVESAPSIVITVAGHDLHVEGHPRRLAKPGPWLLDPARARVLEAAIAELELVDTKSGCTGCDTTIQVGGIALSGGGRCASVAGIAVRGTLGDGCVTTAAWQAVLAAVDAIAKPASAELRPIPVDGVDKITLPDGGIVDLAKRPTVIDGNDSRDADPDRVIELLAMLAAPGAQLPTTGEPAKRSLSAHTRGGASYTLDLFDGGRVARRGEPFALQISPGAWATITRPSLAYRDDKVWLEEPTTVHTLAVDDVTYTRGAVLGEWTRAPAGAVDAAAIDVAVIALSTLRAPAAKLPADFAPTKKLVLTLGAPASGSHRLELGTGCLARADGAGIQLSAELCAKLRALR